MEKAGKIKRAVKCVVFLLVCMALFGEGLEAKAAGMSLAELQAKFPDGKYWNHATQSGHDYNELTLVHSGNCNNPDGYTDMPCTNHNLDIQGAGYYDCNNYGGALQCCGFAYKLADDAYGSMPNNWGTVSVDNAKAGDVIHFYTGDTWGHWAMIIGRNGTTVVLGECNYDNHCRIDWGRECALSGQGYTIYSAPWELQASIVPGLVPDTNSDFKVNQNEDGTVTIERYLGQGGNVEIPSQIGGKKVTEIGDTAFQYSGLKSVVIKGEVKRIGASAFASCWELESVDISGSAMSIEKEAFRQCSNLESVSISGNAINIEKEAFRRCDNLESVNISGDGINLGTLVFSECNLKSVNISGSGISIGAEAFCYCNSLESITIPSGVLDIGQRAFEICGNLKSVTIEDGVKNIGKSAFERCRRLESVVIPGSVRNIGACAYTECDSLSSVTIQEGVVGIGNGAFSQCGNLERVTIPSSVINIDGEIFQSSYRLHEGYHNGVLTTGIIYVESGSVAEQYAKEQHLRYSLISGSNPSQDGSNSSVSCSHSYKITVIPATTKAGGSIVEKCIKCGVEKSRTTICAASSISLSQTSYTYSGKTCKPSVTVKDGKGKMLKNNRDYTVSFPKKAKVVGKYVLTVTLRGNYKGSVKKTFEVAPKGTYITKALAGKKGFTVEWKKQEQQTSGYQIVYSTDRSFAKKSTEMVWVVKSGTVSKSVLKLKEKKMYFIRIRTYKTVKADGKSVKIYSGWSKTKNVITK